MPDRNSRQNDLDQVLTRFPRQANAVRQLYLADEAFRGACEDYALAMRALAAFETRTDAAERPEIADYRRVIADLDRELAALIDAAASN